MDKMEFVNAADLKSYCKSLKLDYTTTVKNFVHRGHLVRIFRGVFYVRPPDDMMIGRRKYTHLELVAKGLEMKGVKNWYFGLHTALKRNNMTHEYFTIDEVINDSLFRAKPINIAGYKFRFIKLSPELIKFGIKEEGTIRYSDPEKTILDFIYLSRHKGTSSEKISLDVGDWVKDISEKKLRKYAMNYPTTVRNTAAMMIK